MSKLFQFCPHCSKPLVTDSFPSHCPDTACGFIHYDNPVPVVAAIVETPAGVVLAHNVMWPTGVFSLPTGFLEHREDPAQAVIREVQEELGLTCDKASLVGVFPFAQQNQVIVAYHLWAEGTITLGDELDEFKVIAVDRLKGWGFGTGLAIQAWLETRRNESAKPGAAESSA